MPGVALIFAKDGAAVSERRLRDLAGRLAYRGTVSGIVATRLAAIAQISRDPRAIGSSTGWFVAVDGRIDNRADLCAELGLPAVNDDGLDDGSVIAAALDRWDAAAAPRLLGDFAIAAIHRHAPRALLIRDSRGLRPLYYCDRDDEVICTSDLQSLVREVSPSIDEGLAAEWLSGAPASHSGTLYRGVQRLPMAHLRDISPTSAASRQYWLPQIDSGLIARDQAEREAAFREVLRKSVEARTVATERCALWLSGGLDSSALAVMLRDAYRGHWRCLTLVDQASGNDERAFAGAVAAALHADHEVVACSDVTIANIEHDISDTLDVPSPPNGLQTLAARRHAVAAGFPVALSGLGSDEWFGGSFLSYGDLAKSGRYLELLQTVWADRHREESTRVRLQIAAWSLCPPWLQRGVRGALNRRLAPPWISPRLAHSACLEDRLRANEITAPDLPLLSQQALYGENIRGAYVAGTEMQERANARCGLDERYPFHDRRVIEFSLALPEADRWSGGNYKGLIRRAMANRLPKQILDRQDSPNANLLTAQTLARLGGRGFFQRLQIAELDWIDRDAALALWDRATERSQPGIEVWQLWAIAAVELWWRHAIVPSAAYQGATTSVA